jgi:hypothetical protein
MSLSPSTTWPPVLTAQHNHGLGAHSQEFGSHNQEFGAHIVKADKAINTERVGLGVTIKSQRNIEEMMDDIFDNKRREQRSQSLGIPKVHRAAETMAKVVAYSAEQPETEPAIDGQRVEDPHDLKGRGVDDDEDGEEDIYGEQVAGVGNAHG